MVSVISAVFVIGILIFVHELGHFIAAKRKGVRVEKFSLGFGPEVISRKIGNTRYIISLIPLGGYVKMAGDNPGEELKGAPDEYLSKDVKDRFTIVVSGPLMNIALCLVILSILLRIGLPYIPARVGMVLNDSPAEKAGLRSGDVIEQIGNKKVDDWNTLTKIIRLNPEKELRFKVKRQNRELELDIRPRFDENNKIGLIGITPYYGRKIGKILKGSPAYKAGLRQGDEIIEVAGKSISQWNEIIEIIEKVEGDNIAISVLRHEGDKDFKLDITIGKDKQLDIYPALPEKRYPFLIAVGKAFSHTLNLIWAMYVGLWQLVSGQISIKTVGGPILIAQLAGHEAQMGLSNLFMFIAIISVNLAVINLLPLPVLDGGHILFLIIENISGRPVSKRKQEIAQQIGVAILIGLMLLVTYNDILRFFSK